MLALALLPATTAGATEQDEARQKVVSANAAFYAAFRNRDMAAMEALWARNVDVAVIHPGWPGVAGREQVMASWRMIFDGGSPPDIRSVSPKAYVHGSTAFVVCYEQIQNGFLIATNIFVLEDGDWRMVHHQAGPTPIAASDLPEEKI